MVLVVTTPNIFRDLKVQRPVGPKQDENIKALEFYLPLLSTTFSNVSKLQFKQLNVSDRPQGFITLVFRISRGQG